MVGPKERRQFSRRRFGIGEWYGVPLTLLTSEERRGFANALLLPKKERAKVPCPFQNGLPCNKEGGVCSLQLYEADESDVIHSLEFDSRAVTTTCPQRFEEDATIYRWVGETILGSAGPRVLGEIGFLESNRADVSGSDVGRIDRVLVVPESKPLMWCALEVQAVYFQGKAMSNDFNAIRNESGDAIPFPRVIRRPDYRSSGPKRLMPQLQIKVPSLRRWGKKMAVVVDRNFFLAMGEMREATHISNSDVAWFVVRYEETESGRYRLVPDDVHFTTLEDSVEGLTAGVAVSLELFEQRILSKL